MVQKAEHPIGHTPVPYRFHRSAPHLKSVLLLVQDPVVLGRHVTLMRAHAADGFAVRPILQTLEIDLISPPGLVVAYDDPLPRPSAAE